MAILRFVFCTMSEAGEPRLLGGLVHTVGRGWIDGRLSGLRGRESFHDTSVDEWWEEGGTGVNKKNLLSSEKEEWKVKAYLCVASI